MHRETLQFHKGLRAIVLPDGRRLASSDLRRAFVEPAQPSPSRSADRSKKSAIKSVAQAAMQVAQQIEKTNAGVPVGPASTAGPNVEATQTSNGDSTAAVNKQLAAAQKTLQALQERIEPLVKKVADATNEFVAVQKIQLQQLEKPTIELALCIAEHVVGQCVDAKQLNMEPLVAQAVQSLVGASEVEVKLNGEDLVALQAADIDLKSFGPHVSVVADATLPAGSCVVASGGRQMASTIRQRLDNARRLVTEEFQHDRA